MILPDRFAKFRGTKTYDLLMAVPLILWFGRGAWQDAQAMMPLLSLSRAGALSELQKLQLVAMAGSILFCALLIVMLLVRTVPRARAAGAVPRVLAVVGTLLGTGYLFLQPVVLPLWLQVTAVLLIVAATVVELMVLTWLGRSFSIMAEARELVTGGPYAVVRHPLYLAETIGITAMLIQFFSAAGVALFIVYVAAQVGRALFEERILAETFPGYAAYAMRTKRFIPFVY